MIATGTSLRSLPCARRTDFKVRAMAMPPNRVRPQMQIDQGHPALPDRTAIIVRVRRSLSAQFLAESVSLGYMIVCGASFFNDFPRPERLGLFIKYSWALNGFCFLPG